MNVSKSLDPSAGHFGADVSMDPVDIGLGEIAPSDARLIGHHDQGETRLAQTLQSGGGFREEFNFLGAVEVVLFVDERSVAIEKNSRFPGVSRHR